MDRSFIEQTVRAMNPFAVLNVTSFCDQRCVFCSEGVREKKPAPSTETVKAIIDGLIEEQRIKCVLFMGGEITLRRDFLELARYVVERGLRLNIATNGLRFAREPFARDALGFIDGMEVSFHAHTAALARAITGRDRFDDLIRAVHNICAIKPGIQITFNVVLNRLNLHHLLDTTRLLARFDLPYAAMIHYKYIKVAGRVLDERSLVPSYTELAGPLTEAMQFCIDHDIHYLFEGVPRWSGPPRRRITRPLIRLVFPTRQESHSERSPTSGSGSGPSALGSKSGQQIWQAHLGGSPSAATCGASAAWRRSGKPGSISPKAASSSSQAAAGPRAGCSRA